MAELPLQPARLGRGAREWIALAMLCSASLAPAHAVEPAETGLETPVRGLVRALTQAMISTEFSAPVLKIGFKEGEGFHQGDLLVEFDCRRQRAELDSTQAQHQEMKLIFENNKVLRQSQALGRNELDISEVRLQKAAAEVEALRVRLDQCALKAPFDGRVSELGIHELETPQQGKPYIGIIADGELEIDLIVPAAWLLDVSVNTHLKFSVDESRTIHDIAVKRLGASIDPLSQTAKITAAFVGTPSGVMPGMSGTAERSVKSQ
jgi:membrane fusion protein, multidrug efflux system